MDCVWPRKIPNAEVDNDAIEVVSVPSDFDVIPCFHSPDALSLVDLLTDAGCMRAPCGPQRFVSQFEESLGHASSSPISQKRIERYEAMMVPWCPAGAPKWIEQPSEPSQALEACVPHAPPLDSWLPTGETT